MIDDSSAPKQTGGFLWATIILCVILATSMTLLRIFAPSDVTTGTALLGVFGPIITLLLARALQGIHVLVNNNFAEAKAGRTIAEAARDILQAQNRLLQRQLDTRSMADASAESLRSETPLPVEVMNKEPFVVTVDRPKTEG